MGGKNGPVGWNGLIEPVDSFTCIWRRQSECFHLARKKHGWMETDYHIGIGHSVNKVGGGEKGRKVSFSVKALRDKRTP